ncbi:hypothetical protein Tco_0354256, partial [Tanacetum coccineum]
IVTKCLEVIFKIVDLAKGYLMIRLFGRSRRVSFLLELPGNQQKGLSFRFCGRQSAAGGQQLLLLLVINTAKINAASYGLG